MQREARVVLVVEDDVDVTEALSILLEEAGFAVVCAANGAEALAALERVGPEVPCVMLLDMMMPVMSGAELLEVLERSERFSRLPVIILSASAANSDRALAVLRKPASSDRILGAVRAGFREVERR